MNINDLDYGLDVIYKGRNGIIEEIDSIEDDSIFVYFNDIDDIELILIEDLKIRKFSNAK